MPSILTGEGQTTGQPFSLQDEAEVKRRSLDFIRSLPPIARKAILQAQGAQLAALPEAVRVEILRALEGEAAIEAQKAPPPPVEVPTTVGLSSSAAVAPAVTPATTAPAQTPIAHVPPARAQQTAMPASPASTAAPAAAPAVADIAAAAAVAATSETREKVPQFGPKQAPETFQKLPEAVYRWSPYLSEHQPLCGLLVHGREPSVGNDKEGKQVCVQGRLVILLTSPTWAARRDGTRIALDPGHRVYLPISDALVPLVNLANHTAGMPNVRITWLGEEPDGAGGVVPKYVVEWELRDGRPRLYSRREDADKAAAS